MRSFLKRFLGGKERPRPEALSAELHHRLLSLVRNGDLQGVKALLNQKRNVNWYAPKALFASWPPLHEATRQPPTLATKLIEVLLAHGADINSVDVSLQTALHVASHDNSCEALEALLGRRADLEATDSYGRTALDVAAQNGHIGALEVLLANGARVNPTGRRRGPLHWAADENRCSALRLLVKSRGEINSSDSIGMTPLHYAAASGRAEAATVLLESNADVNAETAKGETPLRLALQWARYWDGSVSYRYYKTARVISAHGGRE